MLTFTTYNLIPKLILFLKYCNPDLLEKFEQFGSQFIILHKAKQKVISILDNHDS